MLQTIRWAMCSRDASDKLALSAEANGGFISVVVNALDNADPDLSLLGLSGTAIQPDGSSQNFPIEQESPGRFRGKLRADSPGNYFIAIASVGRGALLRSAVSVPATAEFDRLTSNDGLLAQIAEGVPRGGERGELIRAPHGLADTAGLLSTNVFRPGVPFAQSRNPVWPLLLVLGSVLFVGDVCCRRVQLPAEWIAFVKQRIFARRTGVVATADTERMSRLRASKTSATAQFSMVDDATSTDTSPRNAPVLSRQCGSGSYGTSRPDFTT